jgi:hypothetical protein
MTAARSKKGEQPGARGFEKSLAERRVSLLFSPPTMYKKIYMLT